MTDSNTFPTAYAFHDYVIRTMMEGTEPLFCLADICKALELTNPSYAAEQIKTEFSTPKLNLGVIERPDSSRISVPFVTEPQLYFLMMRSRAERAHEFRQWICNEVLPRIRKHGVYATPQAAERLLNDPDFMIKVLTELKEARSQRDKAMQERDYAVKTKAQISDKKTASALGTASAAVKRANKLQQENIELKERLGEGETWRRVLSMVNELKPYFFLDLTAYQQIGKSLNKLSHGMGYEVREVADDKYGSVKAYHKSVWDAFMRIVKNDRNFLGRFRGL